MITPKGLNANNIERVMLLSMWAQFLDENSPSVDFTKDSIKKKIIIAGIGKPTFPIHASTIKSFKSYWEYFDKLTNNLYEDSQKSEQIAAIGYGSPYGDSFAKQLMAKAMSNWYETEILPDNILFTVGGIGALKIIFDAFNSLYAIYKKYRVITPFPYYSAYANNDSHILHPIHVMHEKGYQLTANALEESINSAYTQAKIDGIIPRAVLICNPSNPLGTIIKKEELLKIASVLRRYPFLYIIFDEAYAEINYIDMPSFLNIAPDLKYRTIILRSATKALSSAGERMALILAFNDNLINELVYKQICAYIHPPISGQIAYAETMFNFTQDDRKKLSSYYKNKVNYVIKRLKDMGAEMPCSDYQVEAAFYALGDFSDLFGLQLPEEAEAVLEKKGLVETGEDLAYYLLFKDSIMLAPLSYFGLSTSCGYLRITCSAKQSELEELMNRLEKRLYSSRIMQRNYKKTIMPGLTQNPEVKAKFVFD